LLLLLLLLAALPFALLLLRRASWAAAVLLLPDLVISVLRPADIAALLACPMASDGGEDGVDRLADRWVRCRGAGTVARVRREVVSSSAETKLPMR
jgi:hypothetical protein